MFADLHREKPFHDGTEAIWAEKASSLTPFHYSDGVSLYLAQTDENPGDDFLNQGTAEGALWGPSVATD